MVLPERDGQRTLLGDPNRVRHGVRAVREDGGHLGTGLDIELIARETQPLRIRKLALSADAEQGIVADVIAR